MPEFDFASQPGVHYHVYRVFGAGDPSRVRIVVIEDVVKALRERRARLCIAVPPAFGSDTRASNNRAAVVASGGGVSRMHMHSQHTTAGGATTHVADTGTKAGARQLPIPVHFDSRM